MGVRSIQSSAFAALAICTIAFAIQTASSNATNECRSASPAMNEDGVALAALFTPGTQFETASLLDNAPLMIYAVSDSVREADGVTLVEVSSVADCMARKNSV